MNLSEPLNIPFKGFAELDEIATDIETPAYVYDLGNLERRVLEMRSAFRGCHLYFATMANDRPEVMRRLSDLGLGACVNSVPHMRAALAAGFPTNRVQFTSTGISQTDLQKIRSQEVSINLDSLMQIKEWLSLGGSKAGLRVNAASLTGAAGGDRIGSSASEALAIVRAVSELGGQIVGLHVYVGTNFQDHKEMIPTIARLFELGAKIPQLSYLNIGGGIGIDYSHEGRPFDLDEFGACLRGLFDTYLSGRDQIPLILIEPGRSIAAGCGKFVTRVTDVKVLGGTRYVAVDGSVAIFPRPLHHPSSPHRVRALDRGGPESPCVVVGRTTFSKDILGSGLLPACLTVGDVLVFDDAGAYSQSMMSRFLGQPSPATIVSKSE